MHQLAYFSVGSIDSVNMLLTPLMSMKVLNGLSIPFVGSSTDPLPRRVKEIGYYPAFLDNFNVMFAVLFAEIFLAILFYLITRIIPVGQNIFTFSNRLTQVGLSNSNPVQLLQYLLRFSHLLQIQWQHGYYFNSDFSHVDWRYGCDDCDDYICQS